jgi:hypothetical protein
MTEAELAAKLTVLEDRLAIMELEGQYARTFDSRNGDAWAALFTPDGVYRARDATPEQGQYIAGRAALADFCTNATFEGIHQLHLPSISPNGDRATSRVHLEFLGWWQGDGTPVLRMVGYYDVEYARDGDRWLIAHRVTTAMARENRTSWPYPQGTAFDSR